MLKNIYKASFILIFSITNYFVNKTFYLFFEILHTNI